MWPTIASAAPPQLKGEYAVTGSNGCLYSGSGFTSLFTPVADRTFSTTGSVEGIRVFNGDGTGTIKATEVEVLPPTPVAAGSTGTPPVPDASTATFSFSFTYTVNNDGTFSTQLVPGTFLGTFVQGPRTGQTFTVDNIQLTGLLTNENKVLTLASTQAAVETVTYSTGEVRQRVCHRSRVLSWIGQ
jgi:hypothetical protein